MAYVGRGTRTVRFHSISGPLVVNHSDQALLHLQQAADTDSHGGDWTGHVLSLLCPRILRVVRLVSLDNISLSNI